MEDSIYDVVIVGYGPTGMMLAALIAQRGWRAAVVERYKNLYNLPRAACFDDEVMRLFQKLDLVEDVMPGVVAQPGYQWVNADGETLVEIEYDDPAAGGWAALYMMYQPHVDELLDRHCQRQANIDVFRGLRVDSVVQDDDGVVAHATGADGEHTEIRGKWLVGSDGGTSFVRDATGSGVSSYGFEENWLVCDFLKLRDLPEVPTFQQVCDPRQPISIVRIGPTHHRFSFMLDRDETPEQATEPARVWQRVRNYLTSDDAELIRVANYVFRSRIADQWRHSRVLLAGDAAHEMPPFLAQGMCSGMRDSHNLSWKLDLVLSGRADETILDTYQSEREPHVRFITEKAIELGRVQTLRDPDAARARDERLLAQREANRAPEKLRYPNLRDGLLAVGDPTAGEFFPQRRVRTRVGEMRFDDATGAGICLLARSLELLDGVALDDWRDVGGRVVVLGDPTSRVAHVLVVADVEDAYEGWFESHGCDSVVIRPDWYVYGAASGATELAALTNSVLTSLVSSETVA
jgi:2-polyprenyl-6-methoxyphenol hydroxylase-like FAD-dependent oxidoreductase